MYPLFESICIKDGRLLNAEWHRCRYRNSYKELYGYEAKSDILNNVQIPAEFREGLVKLRIVYNDVSFKTEFEKYQIKKITTLKLVEDNAIEYNLKYSDRTKLNLLFDKREECDDILIIKNKYVTDTLYCNIVFFDGEKWITPSHPLLKGTARERLLTQKTIFQEPVTIEHLQNFTHFKLINAMRDFDVVEATETGNIIQ
jgi:4-amino-4-deoxychorismate lyase